jgi:cytoskeletal protein RodZ
MTTQGENMPEENKYKNPHLQIRPHLIFWAIVLVLFTAVLFFVIGSDYATNNVTISTQQGPEELAPPVPDMPSATPATSATAASSATETTTSSQVSSSDAVEKVKNLPDVKSFYTRVDDATTEIDNSKTNSSIWSVHVFENGADTTATFNWYSVDKLTGEIKPMF